MLHDSELLDKISSYDVVEWDAAVYRITFEHVDPLAFSTSGGRWAKRDGAAILYTSACFEGALAEVAFHWGQFSPLPSKPARKSKIELASSRCFRLSKANLEDLGLSWEAFVDSAYPKTQEIGEAIAFLGLDGFVAPSARWPTENVMVFSDSQLISGSLQLVESEEFEWIAAAKALNIPIGLDIIRPD